MKRKCFLIILFVILIMYTASSQVKAVAATPIWPHKFSRGVSNTCYYIHSSISDYTVRINEAANNWVNTGFGYNPIYMTLVSSNRGTHMDFYGRHDDWFGEGNEGIVGLTQHCDANEYWINPEETDWFFAAISLDIDDLPFNTIADQKGIAAHEMGHAFGLKHYDNNRYSIMYPYINLSLTSVVAQCDHDAINLIY